MLGTMLRILFCLPFVACLQQSAQHHHLPGYKVTATAAVDLQHLFSAVSPPQWGFTGGDVATSLPLANNEYLWLFGDTLYGQMRDNGTRRHFTQMPRNSIGTLKLATNPESTPIQHFIRGYDHMHPQHGGFFSPRNTSQWFWVEYGLNLGGGIYLFGNLLEKGPPGLFPFQTVDYVCIQVTSNLTTNPMNWTYTYTSMGTGDLGWAAVGSDDMYVYLLGNWNHKAILARNPISEVVNGNKWTQLQWWTKAKRWQSGKVPRTTLDVLFGFPPPEATLQYNAELGYWIVPSIFFESTQVQLFLARNITGPWKGPYTVYDIPAPWATKPVFCYAPKIHPELSTNQSSELLFTYMSNSPGINYLTTHPEIYIPQIVRLKLDKCLPEPWGSCVPVQ
eukprot:TRINITY_DN67974_c6_g14_i1.p1 TRINITY_DN67974_c6_g14~~TRINITY_DN67974_c6_g14_i1.p1  ORF type:complete len:391 (+),score=17.90 TRINITY_DN67974_c6_g14_i1:13-1185(+)